MYIHSREGWSCKFGDNSWTTDLLFNEFELSEHKKAKLDLGHFVTRNVQKDLNCFTVWEKKKTVQKVPGKLWGEWKSKEIVIRPVFSLTVVVLSIPSIPSIPSFDHVDIKETNSESDSNEYDECNNYDMFVQDFKKLKVSKRFKNGANKENHLTVVDFRSEYPEEFVQCKMAKNPPQKEKRTVVDELNERFAESEKKKED